jgi:hypothetical protein
MSSVLNDDPTGRAKANLLARMHGRVARTDRRKKRMRAATKRLALARNGRYTRMRSVCCGRRRIVEDDRD